MIYEPEISLEGYKFTPQTDITAYEFAMIWQITTLKLHGGMCKISVTEYAKKYNLTRHFNGMVL